MKGLLIGTDLLKDADGNYKVLEINTNVGVHSVICPDLDKEPLKKVLVDNNITEFHIIYNKHSFAAPQTMYADAYYKTNGDKAAIMETARRDTKGFLYWCKDIADELGIAFIEHEVVSNAVTVPSIEDASSRFILRLSYDMTAIIDEEYAKDKVKFNKLVEGKPYAIKRHHNSSDSHLNIATLDTFRVGDSPNVVVKSRFPGYDLTEYPKILKIESEAELTELKTRLIGSSNEYAEEFIVDDANTVAGKSAVVRSLDIVYGDKLDTMNIGVYRISSVITRDAWADEYQDEIGLKRLTQSSRPKWMTKWTPNSDNGYIMDDDTPIMSPDGSLLYPKDIVENIRLKTVRLSWVDESEIDFRLIVSKGKFDEDVNTFTSGDTGVVHMSNEHRETIMIEVTLENGVVYEDLINSAMVIEAGDTLETMFAPTNRFRVGDSIVVYDSINETLSKVKITGLRPVFVSRELYHVDVEESDIFLPLMDVEKGLTFIQHNPCAGWCSQSHCPMHDCRDCGYCGGCQGCKVIY
jgi:hypothetical protein